jgi:hypothetical protein
MMGLNMELYVGFHRSSGKGSLSVTTGLTFANRSPHNLNHYLSLRVGPRAWLTATSHYQFNSSIMSFASLRLGGNDYSTYGRRYTRR